MQRPPAIHHCTPYPTRFFGRAAELALLDRALAGDEPSLVAMIGPGGQGKTAIVQHWLSALLPSPLGGEGPGVRGCDGVFLWSFYRGKDSDLCLRQMLAYAEGLDQPPEAARVGASISSCKSCGVNAGRSFSTARKSCSTSKAHGSGASSIRNWAACSKNWRRPQFPASSC